MLCPKCRGEMRKGELNSGRWSYFLPEGERHPLMWTKRMLERKGAVLLPPESFGAPNWEHWPAAFWCEECKLLIADYSN